LRTTRITAVKTALDAGGGAGSIKFYDGTRPAAGGTATTLQCTVPLSYTCGTISGQTLTLNPASAGTRVAAATITWARFADSTGAFVMDANVDVTGSGADLELSSVTGSIGAFILMTSGTLSD
jgi:hypothetical protein